ncbi:MAG: CBS domain-containing protein, partial [Microthrixaceae bacterium]|nr:CBS domain-containing protein [Microthrixaceae bacterium]
TDEPLTSLGAPVVSKVEPQATLHDALEEMLSSNAGSAVVVDGKGRYQGVVAAETLTGAVAAMRADAKRHYEELAAEEKVAADLAAGEARL